MTATRYVQPLQHPGPVTDVPFVSVPVDALTDIVQLPAGARLCDALAEAVEALGVSSGQAQILEGTLDEVAYCYPQECADGTRAVGYSDTKHAVTPARIVTGAATVGFRDGERFCHCHVAWFDADGRLRGGHLWPETFIGSGGLRVLVVGLAGAEQLSAPDPQSGMPVFTPHRISGGAVPRGGRGVIARLTAGSSLDRCIQELLRQHELRHVRIDGSLGSLVGVVLSRSLGEEFVDSPATEVILSGQAHLSADGTLDCRVAVAAIDDRGRVHMGELVPGENLVAVTAELLLTEVPD